MICCEQTCNVSMAPSSCVICVRNTIRQRVDFFLLRGPADWSGKRCSTSTFRSWVGECGKKGFIFHWTSFRLDVAHCLPLKCRRNHKLQSFLNLAANRFQWESYLRFSSHCMASNFYQTLCMPGKTCAERHDQCLCQWKFVALPVYRNRSILQWENHFRYDPLLRHGFLQSDICAHMEINESNEKLWYKSWLVAGFITTS